MFAIIILLISLLGTIMFGVIDALFFLFIEEELRKKLIKFSFFDKITIPLFIGGLSSSISIFISSFINYKLNQHYKLVKTPIMDSIGIIIGTILIIFIYIFLKKILYKKKDKLP